MDDLSRIFLGIIAVAALIQAIFLVVMAIAAGRLVKRVEGVTERVEREVRPALDQIHRITRNVGEVSDLTATHARRIGDVVSDTTDKVRESTDYLRMVVAKSINPLVELGAFWRGVQRSVEVLRGGRSRSPAAGGGRGYAPAVPSATSERTARTNGNDRRRRPDPWDVPRPDVPSGLG
jgi:hypothetical protein